MKKSLPLLLALGLALPLAGQAQSKKPTPRQRRERHQGSRHQARPVWAGRRPFPGPRRWHFG
ncbi:MAG: hypothetical protein WKG07_31400 [Hymenobacter sp.]